MASENETVEQACSEGIECLDPERKNGFSELFDRILVAHRNEITKIRNELSGKMTKICRQLEVTKNDTAECEECKKVVAFSEYAVNFGLCDGCAAKRLKVE